MRKLIHIPMIHWSDEYSGSEGLNFVSEQIKKKVIPVYWSDVRNFLHSRDVDKMYPEGFYSTHHDYAKDAIAFGFALRRVMRRGDDQAKLMIDMMESGVRVVPCERRLYHRPGVSLPVVQMAERLSRAFPVFDRVHPDRLREGYAIKTVNQTLAEGETGVLFYGWTHDFKYAMPRLAKDIEVERFSEWDEDIREIFLER